MSKLVNTHINCTTIHLLTHVLLSFYKIAKSSTRSTLLLLCSGFQRSHCYKFCFCNNISFDYIKYDDNSLRVVSIRIAPNRNFVIRGY